MCINMFASVVTYDFQNSGRYFPDVNVHLVEFFIHPLILAVQIVGLVNAKKTITSSTRIGNTACALLPLFSLHLSF